MVVSSSDSMNQSMNPQKKVVPGYLFFPLPFPNYTKPGRKFDVDPHVEDMVFLVF